jgi:LAS superfamily LD-carboxypeptidase LdcB
MALNDKSGILEKALAQTQDVQLRDIKDHADENVDTQGQIHACPVTDKQKLYGNIDPVRYLKGDFNPSKYTVSNSQPQFVRLNPKVYTIDGRSVIPRLKNSNGKYQYRAQYLRKEAADQLLKIVKEIEANPSISKQAKKTFMIVSATRNYEYQKDYIWDPKMKGRRKVEYDNNRPQKLPSYMSNDEKGNKILQQSSMPGTSRHHWGTDIDLISTNKHDFDPKDKRFDAHKYEMFKWLNDNAKNYGFDRPYTSRASRSGKGYDEERWHFSYEPLADSMKKDWNELIGSNLTHLDFKGAKDNAHKAHACVNSVRQPEFVCKRDP